MRQYIIPKSIHALLCLAIAVTACGCSSYNQKRTRNTIQPPMIINYPTPSTIFDYPNAAARYQRPSTTSSEHYIRGEWPPPAQASGYVTTGTIAGYSEYTTDNNRIGSDNRPRQNYNRRTRTYRYERKYR